MFGTAVCPVLPVGDTAGHPALAAADRLPPGPEMIQLLAGLSVDVLDDADRVLFLQCWERASRWLAAQHAAAVVGVAGIVPVHRTIPAGSTCGSPWSVRAAPRGPPWTPPAP